MDSNAVRAQLDRVLASEAFATASRHSRLLRYLVERTLAGEGDRLKEYVLGTEVFDRADSYDPRLDSIVRVEVRRLRSRLEDYYGGAGEGDPIAIVIPRGSYVPTFEQRPAALVTPPAPSSSSEVQTGRVSPMSPMWMIAIVLTLAVTILAVGLLTNGNRAPAEAAGVPGVAVLPFEHYTTDPQEARLVARLTDAVTVELAQIGGLSVSSRTSAAGYANSAEPLTAIAKALNVDFIVEASVVSYMDRFDITARLVDGRLDRKVWVGEYAVPRSNMAAMPAQIAADIAAAVQQLQRP